MRKKRIVLLSFLMVLMTLMLTGCEEDQSIKASISHTEKYCIIYSPINALVYIRVTVDYDDGKKVDISKEVDMSEEETKNLSIQELKSDNDKLPLDEDTIITNAKIISQTHEPKTISKIVFFVFSLLLLLLVLS